MSDIVQNALRYTTTNTKRSDPPNPHNGEIVGKQENGNVIIGFDCSGFVCHVIIESGYRINYENTGGLLASKAFNDVLSNNEIKPGDIILFDGHPIVGHVGIITEFDTTTYIGKFIHMSGGSNKGNRKISDFKIPDDRNKSIKLIEGYGAKREIVRIRRINNDRYSAEVDLHINGSNPEPALKPLGTRVYSNHKLKTPDTKQTVAKKWQFASYQTNQTKEYSTRKWVH